MISRLNNFNKSKYIFLSFTMGIFLSDDSACTFDLTSVVTVTDCPFSLICITGSAIALHCCKDHSKINRKMESSTPCKIVTPENFTLKLGTRDYVEELTSYTIFDADRLSGGFPPNRWNIILLWLFSCPVLFFSIQRPARTARHIFTLYSSNDVVQSKDGPFRARTTSDIILGKCAPKTHQNERQ